MKGRSKFLTFILACAAAMFALLPAAVSAAEAEVSIPTDIRSQWGGSVLGIAQFSPEGSGRSVVLSAGGSILSAEMKMRSAVDRGATNSVEFWLYISDVSLMQGDGQLELNSSGQLNDANEYHVNLPALPLRSGWNKVTMLQTNPDDPSSQVDRTAVNYIRLYTMLNGEGELTLALYGMRAVSAPAAVSSVTEYRDAEGVPAVSDGIVESEGGNSFENKQYPETVDTALPEAPEADLFLAIFPLTLGVVLGGGMFACGFILHRRRREKENVQQ